ncbi:MAG: Macrolide export ATP-binding/permease protein MacB [Pelotomaculum sp. PtaB.Bin104]|nr:MAG: Macrolide export ATP-binding/permease protein MacB [Pelotomaculum sp. PtaB.Bin104]
MNLLESVSVALEGIMTSKLRSFLTTLGIVIGIAAVIAVVAIGQGGRAVLMSEMEKMGTNIFAIFVDWRSNKLVTGREFDLSDVAAIKDKVPEVTHLSPVNQIMSDIRGPKADTNGWDTVFAIRIKDVNSAIRLQKSSPTDFSQHYVDPETDDDITITGVFGDWQLTTGGDGKNLHMSVPIKTGTMTRNGKPYDMAGDVATIEVNCDFVPPPCWLSDLRGPFFAKCHPPLDAADVSRNLARHLRILGH